MKRTVLAFVLIAVMITGAMLAGCGPVSVNIDSGAIVTREYDITDFTEVEVGYAFKIDLTPLDKHSVVITAGENVFKYLDVYKSGDTLKIKVQGIRWSFANTTLEAKITMPELRSLNVSGAAQGNAKGFKSAHDFNLVLSGASTLDINMETGKIQSEVSGASKLNGYLNATGSDIKISGASDVRLQGSGGNIVLNCSGASRATMSDFTVNNADIEISGASKANLYINGKMDASLSGASSLEYGGNPTLGRLDVTGASQIKQAPRQ